MHILTTFYDNQLLTSVYHSKNDAYIAGLTYFLEDLESWKSKSENREKDIQEIKELIQDLKDGKELETEEVRLGRDQFPRYYYELVLNEHELHAFTNKRGEITITQIENLDNIPVR